MLIIQLIYLIPIWHSVKHMRLRNRKRRSLYRRLCRLCKRLPLQQESAERAVEAISRAGRIYRIHLFCRDHRYPSMVKTDRALRTERYNHSRIRRLFQAGQKLRFLTRKQRACLAAIGS